MSPFKPYLSHTAQVVPLQVVALLGGELIDAPDLVRVSVMLFHDIFP